MVIFFLVDLQWLNWEAEKEKVDTYTLICDNVSIPFSSFSNEE